MFGKGEKLSLEYTYGTRNHTDSRINFSSPIDLDPEKQYTTFNKKIDKTSNTKLN